MLPRPRRSDGNNNKGSMKRLESAEEPNGTEPNRAGGGRSWGNAPSIVTMSTLSKFSNLPGATKREGRRKARMNRRDAKETRESENALSSLVRVPLRMVPFWALSKTQNTQVLLQITCRALVLGRLPRFSAESGFNVGSYFRMVYHQSTHPLSLCLYTHLILTFRRMLSHM